MCIQAKVHVLKNCCYLAVEGDVKVAADQHLMCAPHEQKAAVQRKGCGVSVVLLQPLLIEQYGRCLGTRPRISAGAQKRQDALQ
jgi:hypothetical protein